MWSLPLLSLSFTFSGLFSKQHTFAGYHVRPNFVHTISPTSMHSSFGNPTSSLLLELLEDDMSVWPGSRSSESLLFSLLSVSSASSTYWFPSVQTRLAWEYLLIFFLQSVHTNPLIQLTLDHFEICNSSSVCKWTHFTYIFYYTRVRAICCFATKFVNAST